MKIFLAVALCFSFFFSFSQDGSLDQSFGTAGVSTTQNFTVTGDETPIAVQPDGKILQMVNANDGSGKKLTIFRHLANGGLDNTFGTNGKVVSSFPDNHEGRDIILQPDGKILVCGFMYTGSSMNPVVIRFNSNGSVDAGYGAGGKVLVPFNTTGLNIASSMLIQPDGKVLVCGNMSPAQTQVTGLFRLLPDGSLDNSFDADGKLTTTAINIIPNDIPAGLGLQPDGKIVVVGSRTISFGFYQFAAMRFNTDGSVDTGFGNAGVFTSNSTTSMEGTSVAIQADGKILIWGMTPYYGTNQTDYVLMRINPNGQSDVAFGNNSILIIDFPSTMDWAYSVAVQTDGKILVAGFTMAEGGKIGLIRYKPDGTLDNSFGNGGKSAIGVPGIPSKGGQLGFQGNKIVMGGYTYNCQTNCVNPTVFRVNNSTGPYNPLCNVNAPVVSISGNVVTSSSVTGNQWYFNGNPVAGAGNQTFIATQAGSYSATVTSNGCTSALSAAVVYTVTGIDDVVHEWQLQVGPNPVTDQLVISYAASEKLRIELYDVTGRLMVTQNDAVNHLTIDMSGYPAGVYSIRIVGRRSGKEVRRMIVKN